MQGQAARAAFRRTWRWYVAFLVPANMLFAVPKYLGDPPRLRSLLFEATFTLVAVVLPGKLWGRLADLLQQEIENSKF